MSLSKKSNRLCKAQILTAKLKISTVPKWEIETVPKIKPTLQGSNFNKKAKKVSLLGKAWGAIKGKKGDHLHHVYPHACYHFLDL